MAKKQNNTSKKGVAALVVGIILALLTGATLLLAYTARKNDDNFTRLSLALTEQRYAIDKLSFCVDTAISPCDDSAISAWNEKHKDVTFNLKTFEQLIEESIEERRLINK
jgi:hypothetical protein